MVERNPILAVGWATVELDRASLELASVLLPGTSFQPGPPCEHLGARCRVGRVGPEHLGDLGAVVVLLEASTEGRLAATLGRHGEGWCATWELAAVVDEPGVGTHLSVVRDGPLGPERLILGSPASGPHRLLVEAATIEP